MPRAVARSSASLARSRAAAGSVRAWLHLGTHGDPPASPIVSPPRGGVETASSRRSNRPAARCERPTVERWGRVGPICGLPVCAHGRAGAGAERHPTVGPGPRRRVSRAAGAMARCGPWSAYAHRPSILRDAPALPSIQMRDLTSRALDTATALGATYADVRVVRRLEESITIKSGARGRRGRRRERGASVSA